MDAVVVVLRVVLSLAVVLGLLWVLQRRLGRGSGARATNVVTVVGRQGLGQKASVVVVDVDGRRFVLGVTEQSISVLHGSEPAPAALAAVPATSATAFERSLHAATTGDDVTAQSEPEPPLAFRPRRDRSHPPRLAGSILSPSTWQQTAAMLRQGR
ncbi:flagellar biosynthetic protein FliO [Cryobacterium sp. SO2]|uniref:flagellar biosynthetic protein FliO n=1 Tax=Cryobacterium sp. SO2 TaxID=1897060 RepID=UPI00223D34B7|nr:flagellar biosynthetic protein FliO [Cryobacterium sp. SO2]WEO78990.1 flagellar biosynthetic protein FliO [Cryobacterium sp. SO2]